jgi:hypothetical protein
MTRKGPSKEEIRKLLNEVKPLALRSAKVTSDSLERRRAITMRTKIARSPA